MPSEAPPEKKTFLDRMKALLPQPNPSEPLSYSGQNLDFEVLKPFKASINITWQGPNFTLHVEPEEGEDDHSFTILENGSGISGTTWKKDPSLAIGSDGNPGVKIQNAESELDKWLSIAEAHFEGGMQFLEDRTESDAYLIRYDARYTRDQKPDGTFPPPRLILSSDLLDEIYKESNDGKSFEDLKRESQKV